MPLAKDLVGPFTPGQAVADGGQTNSALAALGSSLATAAPIVVSNTVVTGADGTKGVALPYLQPNESVIVCNNSASSLIVYPQATVAISVSASGMGTIGASFTLTTYKQTIITAITATQYITSVA